VELDRHSWTGLFCSIRGSWIHGVRLAILIKQEMGMGRAQHDHLIPALQPLSGMGMSSPGFGKGQGSFIHTHGLAKLTDFA